MWGAWRGASGGRRGGGALARVLQGSVARTCGLLASGVLRGGGARARGLLPAAACVAALRRLGAGRRPWSAASTVEAGS